MVAGQHEPGSDRLAGLAAAARPVPRPALTSRMADYATTVFAEMSALATRAGAVNMGQGFPDEDGPAEVIEAAIASIRSGQNQYPPGAGVAPLLTGISDHQRRFYGLDYDPGSEILVTAGATEAIAATVLALCESGDEVVTFEPYYDSYAATVALAGAERRVVRLRPPDWSFDFEELARAITPRTRLLLVNSPHNPTGHVFSADELGAIAALCVERDLLAVTDEVYEHLVFDGRHLPLACHPGMRDRTIAISSAGKTFSVTGWKIGWICGPESLVSAVRTVKQFLTFASGTPFQHGIAAGLGLDDAFYTNLASDLRARRDLFCDGLERLGWTVLRPEATYFATVDIRRLWPTERAGASTGPGAPAGVGLAPGVGLAAGPGAAAGGGAGVGPGMEFCRWLTLEHGVAAVPTEVFYDDPHAGESLVRFAFCKSTAVLEEALSRLEAVPVR